jgi:predicted dehydrogenase
MDKVIHWGILGCGRIARKFASDLRLVEGAELVAIGSRSQDTGDAFAKEFPVRSIHRGYEALASDPAVDVIYIATPHAQHHEHCLLCLDRGKAVLCEKAFAINERQVREMIGKARSANLFLMEALWTKFLPHYQRLMEFVQEGRLGQIRNLLANFGFLPIPPIPQRLYDPSLGGGTVLDIGIYNVFLALSVLGRPDRIMAKMTPAATGVDDQCAVVFTYASGAIAQLFSSFSSNLATDADISGNGGRIRLTSRFYEPGTTIEYYPGRVETREIIPFRKEAGFGYQFEARHVGDCLRMGLTESPVMSHGDSLLLMETLDRVRSEAGIRYPADAP